MKMVSRFQSEPDTCHATASLVEEREELLYLLTVEISLVAVYCTASRRFQSGHTY